MNGVDGAIGTEGTRHQSLLSLLEGPLQGHSFRPRATRFVGWRLGSHESLSLPVL